MASTEHSRLNPTRTESNNNVDDSNYSVRQATRPLYRHQNKMEMFLLRRFPRNIYHDIRFYCRCWDVREGFPPTPLLAVLTGRAFFAVPMAKAGVEMQRGSHPNLHTATSLADVAAVTVEHEAPTHLRLPPNSCCHVICLTLRNKDADREISSCTELDSPRSASQLSTNSTSSVFWKRGRRSPLTPLLENFSGSTPQDRKNDRQSGRSLQLLVLGSDHELARHLQTCWHAHLQRATLALSEMMVDNDLSRHKAMTDNGSGNGPPLRSYFRCGALWKDERLPLLLSSRLQQLLKRGHQNQGQGWPEDDRFPGEPTERSPLRVVLLLLGWLLDSLRSADCAEARDQVLGRGTGALLQNLLLLAFYVGGQPFGRQDQLSEEDLHLGYVTSAVVAELLESCERLKFSPATLLSGADIAPFMGRSGAQVLAILRPKIRTPRFLPPSPVSPSGSVLQTSAGNHNWTTPDLAPDRLDVIQLTPERTVKLFQQLYVMRQLIECSESAKTWLKTSFREELRYYLRWDAVSHRIPDRYPVKQLIPPLLEALRKCAGLCTNQHHF